MLIFTPPSPPCQSVICLLAPAAEVASFKHKKFHPSSPLLSSPLLSSFIKFQADNDDDDYNGRAPSVYDVQSRGGERREGGKGCEDSDRVITRLFTLPDYRLAAGEERGERGV